MFRSARGFTLAEVVVATGVLTTVAVGVAQMFLVAAARTLASRQLVATSALATKKIEELRALAFSSGNTAADLSPSPSNALDEDVSGFVDYFDAQGTPVDATHAVFTRRWSIVPLTDSGDTIVITALATVTARERARLVARGPVRLPEDAVVVTVRTKRSP